jgi:class 3 adenylate cyclase
MRGSKPSQPGRAEARERAALAKLQRDQVKGSMAKVAAEVEKLRRSIRTLNECQIDVAKLRLDRGGGDPRLYDDLRALDLILTNTLAQFGKLTEAALRKIDRARGVAALLRSLAGRAGGAIEQTKTVVDLDLVGYRRIARAIERRQGGHDPAAAGPPEPAADRDADAGPSGPLSYEAFEREIRGDVARGLEAVDIDRLVAVMETTADGAVLVFDEAAIAHHFARSIHQATRQVGKKKGGGPRRRYRIGAATGPIQIQSRDGYYAIAGPVIADAIHLQMAGRPGDLLVDSPTYEALPEGLRPGYRPEAGGASRLPAHRCRLVEGIAADEPAPRLNVDVMDVMDLYRQLVPRDQIIRIMSLIDMPIGQQPSVALTPDERFDRIVHWAKRDEDGLTALREALVVLLRG